MRLHTKRLTLRELEESDHIAANAYESDPEVVQYMSFDSRSLDGSLEFIRRVRTESQQAPRRLFDLAMTLTEGALIGRCGLRVNRPEHREAELWYIVRRDCWGQGYAYEAVHALMAFAFATLDVHRIYVDCDPRNTGSIRLAEKLGMRREGLLRENWFLKGEWCDSAILSVLEHEWHSQNR